MSSTGVRDQDSSIKRVIKGLILNEAQFIQSLRVFANSSTLSGFGATGGDSNNSPNEPSGNYLARSGDTMLGQFGNAFDTIAATNIVSDTLDVSKTSGVTFPVVILQGESPPAADDLVTITQGSDVFPFQELVIRTRSSIITVKNSDNINTPDGNDLVLPVGSIIHLYFDTFLGEWVIDGGTPFFSGGSGVTFPIRPPIDDRGIVVANVTYILSNTTGHILKFTLGANINVIFNNFPIIGIQQEWEVEIIQDGTTPFVITWPVSVINPPAPSSYATLGSTTIVVFRTNDAGTTIRVGNTVTTTSGVSTLSALTIDVNKDWGAFGITNLGALTGVTGIDLDGATALIQGPQKIDFFQSGQQIESLITGIEYSVGDLQSHLFKSLTDNIAEFKEIASGVFRLLMFNHSIRDAKDFLFDSAALDTISNLETGFGFDNVANELKYHVPTGNKHVWTVNNADTMILSNVSLTFADGFIIICNPSNLLSGLNVGSNPTNPTLPSNADIWYNSTSNTLFGRINGVNVDLGASSTGANTALSNLITTSINQDLLFNATGFVIGSAGTPVQSVNTERLLLRSGAIVVNVPSITSVGGSSVDLNFPTGSGFNIYEQGGAAVFTFSPTTFTTPNIILQNTFNFNNNAAFPLDHGIARNGEILGITFDEVTVRRVSAVPTEEAEISLVKIDATPSNGDRIGALNFDVLDTPTLTRYVQIAGGIIDTVNAGLLDIRVRADNGLVSALFFKGDDNNSETFLTVNSLIDSSIEFGVEGGSGGTFNVGPLQSGLGASIKLGVVVQDNVSYTVGTLGTIAIPASNLAIPPTKAILDAAFGTHKGAIGLDIPTFVPPAETVRLWVLSDDGSWYGFPSDIRVT